MKFDVIIATYNRPKRAIALIKQILKCSNSPNKIILVDSSDDINIEATQIKEVVYVRSSHKNQPYQRLLGAKASNSDIVVFFDDDLTITTPDIFNILLASYNDPKVVGSTVGIDYHSSIQDNFDAPVMNQQTLFAKFIGFLSGVPSPVSGKAGRLGVVGGRPIKSQDIDFFYGPCMSFRRDIIDLIIPYDLLSLFEQKLGMGEDKVISMLATQHGSLFYNAVICLSHPPNESTYYLNQYKFSKKVIYSRLYLSKIYAQINRRSLWFEKLVFYYFSLWRILLASLSCLMRPSRLRLKKLHGFVSGLLLAIKLPQKTKCLTPTINWKSEIQKDLQRAGCIGT